MKHQFNGNTEKRHPPPHLTGHEVYEIVKDVHIVLRKRKKTDKNIEEDDMWKKQLIFQELSYWKDLDVHHSIDVMHIERNMCKSLLGTLLNMHWLDDLVKGTTLPTSCINLSKYAKEFCGFLKNVKVPSDYSTNVSSLISLPNLQVGHCVKSHDYHVLLAQMIVVGIQKILWVNVREAIMNFCFFFNAIGLKVLSEEALESLEKRHYETLCFLEMHFPPSCFGISVHFTTHLINEIKLLGPVFLH
jgi:hypothetical protein